MDIKEVTDEELRTMNGEELINLFESSLTNGGESKPYADTRHMDLYFVTRQELINRLYKED